MKKKSLHDVMLESGEVYYGYHSDGRLFDHGKPVVTDVVTHPQPKLNVAPKLTDPPKPKVETTPTTTEYDEQPEFEVTGLQRAINANIAAQGGKNATVKRPKHQLTGLQRAIFANVEQAKQRQQN